MKELRKKIKKAFSRKLTFMIVPHSTVRSFSFNFSVSFAMFAVFLWTSLTFWASWAVFSNVDYWKMKVDHEVLKLKVDFFVRELKKSRELVDQVRQADVQLRQLLGMKDRQSIIQAEPAGNGKGGAEPFEISILQKEINKRVWEITDQEILQQSEAVQRETKDSLQSYTEIAEFIAFERGLFRSTPRGWPAMGRVTSHFGQRVSPMHGGPQFHMGIDIANQEGTAIYATADGIVQLADWEGGYGKMVVIDHGFNYTTYYGHNSKILVQAGDKVKRGQVIAYMGSTGSSTGDHIHYEVLYNGRAINPWKYLVSNSVDELMAVSRNNGLNHFAENE